MKQGSPENTDEVMNGNLPPKKQQISLDLIIYPDDLNAGIIDEQGSDSDKEYSIQSIDERAHRTSTILEGILQRVELARSTLAADRFDVMPEKGYLIFDANSRSTSCAAFSSSMRNVRKACS